MKKYSLFLFVATLLFAVQVQAQEIFYRYEPGSLPARSRCWSNKGMDVSTDTRYVLEGVQSAYTKNTLTINPEDTWVKSPWTKLGSDSLTFKVRLQGGGASLRQILIRFIPYDSLSASSTKEGTPLTQTLTYTFSNPIVGMSSTFLRRVSFPIPNTLKNNTLPYKVMISFLGAGGTGSVYIDDIVISGIHWSNPVDDCLPYKPVIDTDGDGIADVDDAYPNDRYKAYNTFCPGPSWGTYMYEDLWPAKGDYDFNDLVLDFRYKIVTNSDNRVVFLHAYFTIRAVGATYQNALGLQFDKLNSNKIRSVKGAKNSNAKWTSFDANGTESGQEYANIIVYDNISKYIKNTGGFGVNVSKSFPSVVPDTTEIIVEFDPDPAPGRGIRWWELDFNPYLIVNQERGKEIHLPGYVPTTKAATKYFGQGDDDTDLSKAKYYKSKDNLPWGLELHEYIPHMQEYQEITKGYLRFFQWAQSNGTIYKNWYKDWKVNRDYLFLYTF